MSNKPLEVRVAGPDDVAVLAAVGSAVFWDAYGGTAPDADIASHIESNFSEDAVAAAIARNDVTYLLAQERERCAGLIKICDGEVPKPVSAGSSVEVQQLYVSTDFQRRGIGALLLDKTVILTRNRGVAGIWLSCWTQADWAMAFYLKYGFSSLGEIAFRLADTDFVDNLMWIPVGE